jgi:platelet-activating factor acetylhydrolase IB subunit alpha
MWDIITGKHLKTFYGHNHEVTSLCILSNGDKIISGSRDKKIKIWHTNL